MLRVRFLRSFSALFLIVVCSLRPWSFRMWELIQDFMNVEFRKREVQNCYFPCFVTEDALKKEEAHLNGFAAEVSRTNRVSMC
jgi:prolyl-tRNA synthetase